MSDISYSPESMHDQPENFETGFEPLEQLMADYPDDETLGQIRAVAMDNPAAALELTRGLGDELKLAFNEDQNIALGKLTSFLEGRVEQQKISNDLLEVAKVNLQSDNQPGTFSGGVEASEKRLGQARDALEKVLLERPTSIAPSSEQGTEGDSINQSYNQLLHDSLSANTRPGLSAEGFAREVRENSKTWVESVIAQKLHELPADSKLEGSVATILGSRNGLDVILAQATGQVRSLDEVLSMPISQYAEMLGARVEGTTPRNMPSS
jgi:hypothetical protein